MESHSLHLSTNPPTTPPPPPQNSEAQGLGKLLTVFKWLVGVGSPGEDWKFDPQVPARVWLMPRPSPTSPPGGPLPPAQAYEVAPSVAWHMVNAFEEEGEGGAKSIVLDCLRHPTPTFTWGIETANSVSSSAHLTRIQVALGEKPAPVTDATSLPAGPAQQGAKAGSWAQLAGALGISTHHFSASKSQVSPTNGEEGGSDPTVRHVAGWQVGEKRSIELGVSHPGLQGKKHRYVYLVGAPEVEKNLPFQVKTTECAMDGKR